MISFDCIFDHRDLHYTVGRQALRVSLRARLQLDVPLEELVFRYKGVTAWGGRGRARLGTVLTVRCPQNKNMHQVL